MPSTSPRANPCTGLVRERGTAVQRSRETRDELLGEPGLAAATRSRDRHERLPAMSERRRPSSCRRPTNVVHGECQDRPEEQPDDG